MPPRQRRLRLNGTTIHAPVRCKRQHRNSLPSPVSICQRPAEGAKDGSTPASRKGRIPGHSTAAQTTLPKEENIVEPVKRSQSGIEAFTPPGIEWRAVVSDRLSDGGTR